MTTDKLIFAVPSKGRLMEQTCELLAARGLTLSRVGHARGYRGAIDELPDVEVAFVSASEIAAQVKTGAVHFGVTGEDLQFLRGREGAAEFHQFIQRVIEVEVRQHAGVRQEGVRVQIAQGLRLHGAAEKERLVLQRVGQIRDDRLADFLVRRPVDHQAERALRVVLADEDDGAVEAGAGQLSAIEEELAFQRFEFARHRDLAGNLQHACGADNPVYAGGMKSLLWLVLLAVTLVATGCQTDKGSREFIPGKGWVPMGK